MNKGQYTKLIEGKIADKKKEVDWLERQLSEHKAVLTELQSIMGKVSVNEPKPPKKRVTARKNWRNKRISSLKPKGAAYKAYRLIQGHGPMKVCEVIRVLGIKYIGIEMAKYASQGRYFKRVGHGKYDIYSTHMPTNTHKDTEVEV